MAIRLIGAGIHEDVETDKFIKFTTALECLLIPGNQNDKSKTESLAERCVFLLEEDPSERYKIFLTIKDLYGIRGRSVHDGATIPDSKCVSDLMKLAIRCLFKLIVLSTSDANMREIEDIISWVDNKKMKNYYGDEAIRESNLGK